MSELLPYFHPTQLVLIDNDIDFLGNLSLQLEADLAYLLFDSAEKALHYINDRDIYAPSAQKFFKPADASAGAERHGSASVGPIRASLDTSRLLDELYFSNRFSQISVIMVDYAMPQMNGLEFCRRIRNPNVKKILFTGVATEVEAVGAFNDGVIDHFIRKSEYRVYDTLNRTIRSLQHAHIRALFDAATDVFNFDEPEVLSDPAVVGLMDELCVEYNTVEYYLVSDPWGFVMADAAGNIRRLVLADSSYIERQGEFARSLQETGDIAQSILSGAVIVDPVMIVSGAGKSDVKGQLVRATRPAHALRSRNKYVWAVFDGAGDPQRRADSIQSYNQYLEWIDTQSFSMM